MKHDIDACGGKWIDVSTLSRPRVRMCTVCRVSEPIPTFEPPASQGAQDDMTPERFMELMGEAEKEDRALTRELAIVRMLAIAVIIVAFLAAATVILR